MAVISVVGRMSECPEKELESFRVLQIGRYFGGRRRRWAIVVNRWRGDATAGDSLDEVEIVRRSLLVLN